MDQRIQEELDRIEKYWDKKTLFVHRRALLTGVFLGYVLGLLPTILIIDYFWSKIAP